MQQMGGQFLYRQVADSMLIDPERVPTETTQQELTHEIELHQALFDLDHQYCVAVEGASQESNLWVPRNQAATGLTDVDLQRFKSIAWNECVVKRFLTNQSLDVSAAGASMLHIVRTLNLQWKGMEVTGLHPKVESAEKQVVMACMEHRLLPYELDVGRVARCLRRCHHFRDYFANAVGCHVVAKTGHTPGLSKTRYSTDFDYVYKHQGLTFLHSALSKNKGLINDCIAQDGLDYVPRLCGLKLISNASVTLQNPPERPQIIYDNSSPRPHKKYKADNENDTRVNVMPPPIGLDQSALLRDIAGLIHGMQTALQHSIAHQQPVAQVVTIPPAMPIDNTDQIRDILNVLEARTTTELAANNQQNGINLQTHLREIDQLFRHINGNINDQTNILGEINESVQSIRQRDVLQPPQQAPPAIRRPPPAPIAAARPAAGGSLDAVRPPAVIQPAVDRPQMPVIPQAPVRPAVAGPIIPPAAADVEPISPQVATRPVAMWPVMREMLARWRSNPAQVPANQSPAAAHVNSDSDSSASPPLTPSAAIIPLQHEPIKKPQPATRAAVTGTRNAPSTTPVPFADDDDIRSITSLLD